MLIYHISDLALEVGEQNTAGAQILCFRWLSAVLLLRIRCRSPSRCGSEGCWIPGWHRSASHLLLLLITLLHLTVNTQPSLWGSRQRWTVRRRTFLLFSSKYQIFTQIKCTFVLFFILFFASSHSAFQLLLKFRLLHIPE